MYRRTTVVINVIFFENWSNRSSNYLFFWQIAFHTHHVICFSVKNNTEKCGRWPLVFTTYILLIYFLRSKAFSRYYEVLLNVSLLKKKKKKCWVKNMYVLMSNGRLFYLTKKVPIFFSYINVYLLLCMHFDSCFIFLNSALVVIISPRKHIE